MLAGINRAGLAFSVRMHTLGTDRAQAIDRIRQTPNRPALMHVRVTDDTTCKAPCAALRGARWWASRSAALMRSRHAQYTGSSMKLGCCGVCQIRCVAF